MIILKVETKIKDDQNTKTKGLKAISKNNNTMYPHNLYDLHDWYILESLGDFFGFGEIELGMFSILFTIFCVVGIMNAFNMIDGINGLCSGSAMLCTSFYWFFSGLIYDSMLVLVIGSMIGFLIFNLRFFWEKTSCLSWR